MGRLEAVQEGEAGRQADLQGAVEAGRQADLQGAVEAGRPVDLQGAVEAGRPVAAPGVKMEDPGASILQDPARGC